MRWHADPVVVCNAAEILIEHADCGWIQILETRCIACKVLLLNVGLKHETTAGDAPSSQRRMPEMFANDSMPFTDFRFDDKQKTIQIVAHRQCYSRSVSSIIPNLYGVRQGLLDDLMSRFVNASCVLIIRLRLEGLCARTEVEVFETHADGNRTCQGSQDSRISGLSGHLIWMTERSLNRVTVLSGMTRNCSPQNFFELP